MCTPKSNSPVKSHLKGSLQCSNASHSLRHQPRALCCVPVPQKHWCQHRAPTGSYTQLLVHQTGSQTAPQGHPTRGNRAAFTSLGDSLLQTNKFKGSQRMHYPSLKSPTSSTQHSTVPGPILLQIPVWICIQKHLPQPTSSALLRFDMLHHYLHSQSYFRL